jgi:hypothetical protein
MPSMAVLLVERFITVRGRRRPIQSLSIPYVIIDVVIILM